MSVVRFLESDAGRWVRVAAGLALIGVAAALGGWWWLLAAVGALPLLTGVAGVCLIGRGLDLIGRHGPHPA